MQIKGPYEVVCKCGNKTLVSHSVIHRVLVCNFCKRATYYERDLKGTTRVNTPVGRFQSKKELERRLYAKATANKVCNEPTPKQDKESPRLRGNKDSNLNPVDRPKDAVRSVLRTDKGLPDATGQAYGVGRKVKKARVAK